MRLMTNNWAALILAETCWIAPAAAQTPTPCPKLQPTTSRSTLQSVCGKNSDQISLARSLSLQMRRSISQATQPHSPSNRVCTSGEPGTVWIPAR